MAGARPDIAAGRAFVTLYVKNSAFYRGLRNARNRLREFGADMQAIGRQLVVISAAMLVPLAMSAKTFASFDDEMRKVGARSRGTADELAELRDIAKDLGATTSFTAGQVAALQAKIAQKGFDRSGIAQMTDDILNLARAAGEGGEGDTTVAADLVSGNLRAFRLEAEQAAYLSDLFAATVNNSNFSLEGLTSALSSAAPIANRYGISIKDTVNVLAQMTNVNIDAASAGTAFRNMLLKLSDEAGRSKFNASIKAMTGNTIDFVDSAGNLKPLPQLLFDIGDAVKGLGSAQQGQLLSNLFGLRAVVAGGVLSDARNSFGELNDILSDVGGTAKRTSDEMDAGLGGMFRIIMSGVEGVKIALGEALEGSLTDVGTAAQDLLGIARELVENNQEAVVTFAKWAVGIGLAGSALLAIGLTSSLASVAIGGLMAIVSMSTAAFGLLLLPITAVRIAISALTAIVTLSRAVFMSLVGAVAVVRGAMISLVVAMRLLRAVLLISATALAAVRTVVMVTSISIASFRAVVAFTTVVIAGATAAMKTYQLVMVFNRSVMIAVTAAWRAFGATVGISRGIVSAFALVMTSTTVAMAATRSAMLATRAAVIGLGIGLGLVKAAYMSVAASATLATIASQAFAAVGFVISALTSPIAIVAVAVAALGYVAFRAVGGFEGLAEIARSVMGSISRAAENMVERTGALFGQLKKTGLSMFFGIRDAIATGDLQLAGQIALTGLRLAFFQGMDAIGIDWEFFSGGLVETFRKAGAEIVKAWHAAINAISDSILKLAANNKAFNAAFKFISGVDVQAEIERARKLGNEASLPDALKPQAELVRAADDGSATAESSDVTRLRAELAALVAKAREAREKADSEAAGGFGSDDGGYVPGGAPDKGSQSSAPAAVTFSAAGLVALGGGSGQMSDAARETRILARILKESEREQTKAQAEAARVIVAAIATLGLHHA